jgi:osmotically-inducible protein OsmY
MTSMLAPFRDAWLASRARLALLASGADVGGINVEAYHGRVQLSGDAPTVADRAAAERAVRALSGVVSVSNRIRIGAAPTPARRSDEEIRTAVASALAAARWLRGSRVAVAIYDGVVTLTGSARTDAARSAAFEIAVHVPGVRRVVSDVAVSSTADIGRRADAA